MEIEMESRRCVKCNSPFRVLKTSAVKTCSTMCAEFGVPGPVPNRLAAGPKVEKITIAPPKFRHEPDKKQAVQAEIKNWLTKGPNQRERLQRDTPQPLSNEGGNVPETSTASGSERTQRSAKPPTNATRTTTTAPPKSSARVVPPTTAKTKPGETSAPGTIAKLTPSDRPRATLETVALDSMSLLQKSGNKLMVLIEECVKESDLERSADGTQRVESHRIQQALDGAKALAQTVQVQVNMVKAVSDFMGVGDD